jgi:hypothetical protein
LCRPSVTKAVHEEDAEATTSFKEEKNGIILLLSPEKDEGEGM